MKISSMDDLHITSVEKKDLAALTALYTTYLNGGEPIVRHLCEGMERPGYIGIKCLDGEKIAGVVTAIPGIDFTYPHPELEQRILGCYSDANIYSFDMALVLPEYQGQGIAHALAEQLHRRLLEAKTRTLVVELWNPLRQGDRPAERILKYLGNFRTLWDCPDFYKDLYAKGMTCPDCGEGPCRCGATIGIVDLKELEDPA